MSDPLSPPWAIEYDADEATLIATDPEGASEIVAYNVAAWFGDREQARERVIAAARDYVNVTVFTNARPALLHLQNALAALDRLSEP